MGHHTGTGRHADEREPPSAFPSSLVVVAASQNLETAGLKIASQMWFQSVNVPLGAQLKNLRDLRFGDV